MTWDPPLEYYTERGVEPPGLHFIPGEDYDPHDEGEVESVKLAMQQDMHQQLEDMRRRLAFYETQRSEEDRLDDYWETD